MDKYYQVVFEAYKNIFSRCGVNASPVEASSGSIGGSFCHEFTYLGKAGEDKVIICSKCDYAANVEQAEGKLVAKNPEEKELPVEEIPAQRGVNMELMAEFYQVPLWRLLKTIVYLVKAEPVAVVIRGDLEINEVKLEKVFGTNDFRIPEPEELKKLKTVRGFVGPVGLPVTRFLVDQSVLTVKNLITGANKLNFDLKNFNYPRDLPKGETVDVANVKTGFFCPKCAGELKEETAIELGHVFKLGTKYSEKMQAYFTDEKGERKVVWMGCYGIGLGRLLAAIVESNHDEKGIVWPKSVAPFQVELIAISNEQLAISKKADEIYDQLRAQGIDVLYDDRENVSAGVKFSDADLIGIPVRLVVSAKTGDKVEYKERNKKETELLTFEEVIKRLFH
ncbi:MAG: proline--tRNA ligase [Patescibacteria group bacterium]|nr:proline--tRNA ligase [Patescibacteria group bacterium]